MFYHKKLFLQGKRSYNCNRTSLYDSYSNIVLDYCCNNWWHLSWVFICSDKTSIILKKILKFCAQRMDPDVCGLHALQTVTWGVQIDKQDITLAGNYFVPVHSNNMNTLSCLIVLQVKKLGKPMRVMCEMHLSTSLTSNQTQNIVSELLA